MFGFGKKPAPAPAAEPARRSRGRDLVRNMSGNLKAFFGGASVDRLNDSWGTTPLTADDVVERHQTVLVARSREQAANNDYAKSFLRMCRQNIVGQGVMLTAKAMTAGGKLDRPLNEALEWAFFEWSKAQNCDITGRRSLRAVQNAVVQSAAMDGEYMVRMVYGDDAGPWGFSLQVLDPQRCPVLMNIKRPQGGGFIRHGIHFNQYGRPTAYYFSSTDEATADYWYGGQAYIRVPAEDIIHGFEESMTGQKRGLPWMATSLLRMRNMNGMEEASIVNARVGAAKMGFIQWEPGTGPVYEDEDDTPEIDAQAAEWTTLPEGAKIAKWDPQYPTGEYAVFMKQNLRAMAAGMGVPYNELAADLEGVNFSSIRQGTLDSREHWKDRQAWLIETMMDRVYAAWLPRAVLGGFVKVRGKAVSAVSLVKYQSIEWQARRWQWIDPRADVDAAVDAKNNMFTSPSAVIREQGRDPLAVWTETARDVKSMIDSLVAEGLPEKDARELVMLSFGKQPEKPVPPPAAKAAA